MGYKRILAVGMMVGSLGIMESRAATGAEWSAEPSVSVRGDYNSNLLLTGVSPAEVVGHWISPGVRFAGSTETLEVSGRAAADFVSYYGDRNTSFTNLYFPLSVRHRRERDVVGIEGGLTRDNTLMGELQQTGIALAFTQRNLWTAAPSWTRTVTERTSMVAGYQFAHATYENRLRFGLVDYQTHSGNAGVSHLLTDRTQVSLMAIGTWFQAPRADLETQIYGAQASITHDFTDTLRGKVEAGPRFVTNAVESGGTTLRDSTLVWVANASVRKQLERTSFTLDASRELNPSGFGLLIRTDRIGLLIEHQVTENLRASLYGQVLVASLVATTGLNIAFPDNRYVSAQPKLMWRINDWWSADLWYTYGRRDVESLGDTGVSHSATFVVTYTPAKWSVGR